MGKNVNVQKGKKGFQPRDPKPVSPTGKRSFFSRLFGGKDGSYEPLVPDGNYALDDWGTGSDFQFDQMSATVKEKTGNGISVEFDTSDKYRFGPHAVGHAQIDTKRQEVLSSLSDSESYDAPDGKGNRQRVSLNFNPSRTRPLINSLAYSVLEESGYFDGSTPKYRGVNGVYSKETIRCAERIYKAEGKENFTDRRHDRESTAIFPCETTKTPDSISYKYYIHPDVSTLVHGVEEDQKKHSKLQAEISDHQNRTQARTQVRSGFDLDDW